MRWNPRRSPAIELDRQGRSRRRFRRAGAIYATSTDRSMLAGPVGLTSPTSTPTYPPPRRGRRRVRKGDGIGGVDRERLRSKTEGETERTAESWRRKKCRRRRLTRRATLRRVYVLLSVPSFVLHSPPFYRPDLLTSRRHRSSLPRLCPSRVHRFYVPHRLLPSVSPTFACPRRHRLNFSKLASSTRFSPMVIAHSLHSLDPDYSSSRYCL